MVVTAQSVVITAQRGVSNCAAAQARSLEGTLPIMPSLMLIPQPVSEELR